MCFLRKDDATYRSNEEKQADDLDGEVELGKEFITDEMNVGQVSIF